MSFSERKIKMSLRTVLAGEHHKPHPELTSPGRGEFDRVARHYDHLMRHVPYARWVDYVEALIRRRGCAPRRVLDLCCGTGRVGAELARRGYEVFGVDLSEPMVRGCRSQQPPLLAAVMDAAALGLRPEQFDLVVSLYDSLNYILDPAKLAACFRDVWTALVPGGLLIFDLNTPRALSAGLFTQNNLGTPDPLQYSWKAHWDRRRRLCRVDMWFRWCANGEEETYEETHWQYAYRTDEVVGMLADAGFSAIETFEAYTTRPVSRWSDRVYHVAQKEH